MGKERERKKKVAVEGEIKKGESFCFISWTGTFFMMTGGGGGEEPLILAAAERRSLSDITG